MKSELLNKACLAALDIHAGLGDLCWQGDFGKGVGTGSGVWSDPGANPCLLYGPVSTSGSAGGGVLQPQWKLGMVVHGDSGAEFVFGKLVLGSPADLLPGQAYQLDENFSATLLTTSNSVLNAEVGVLNVFAVQQAAGTYYAWFQRAGHAAVQAASGSAATAQAETTATAGQLKFPSGSHTGGTKSTDEITAFGASSSISFTASTASGSPYLTAVASAVSGAGGGVADLTPGMVITGTGLPANAIIAAIDKQGGQWRIAVGTNSAGAYSTLQNATANGAGATFTVSSHVIANLKRPILKTAN